MTVFTKTEPGRKLHEVITACDELWDSSDAVTKAPWVEMEGEVLRARMAGPIAGWRAEARRLSVKARELDAEGYPANAEMLRARAAVLRQCARELQKEIE